MINDKNTVFMGTQYCLFCECVSNKIEQKIQVVFQVKLYYCN